MRDAARRGAAVSYKTLKIVEPICTASLLIAVLKEMKEMKEPPMGLELELLYVVISAACSTSTPVTTCPGGVNQQGGQQCEGSSVRAAVSLGRGPLD